MFATSKIERLEKLRKFANSFEEWLPEPSAILLVILKAAARNCSAKRKSF